jgi:hypothetical protein
LNVIKEDRKLLLEKIVLKLHNAVISERKQITKTSYQKELGRNSANTYNMLSHSVSDWHTVSANELLEGQEDHTNCRSTQTTQVEPLFETHVMTLALCKMHVPCMVRASRGAETGKYPHARPPHSGRHVVVDTISITRGNREKALQLAQITRGRIRVIVSRKLASAQGREKTLTKPIASPCHTEHEIETSHSQTTDGHYH